MKVAWLLATFIAIVTYTPQLEKSHSPTFYSYKLKVSNLKKYTNKLSGFNDNYNLHMIYIIMIYIIITPLHTCTFSLTTIIKHLF